MYRAVFSACLLCCALFCSVSVLASATQAQNYQSLYGDFDGDDRIDLLEISHTNEQPTRFVSDFAGDASEASFGFSIDPANQYLVAGDFDHDDKEEFLVLNASLEGEYYLLNDNLQLVEGDEKLRIKGYNESRRIAFTHLYRGDFNGDTVDDLLAYAAETHDIVVFHNKNRASKIKFKFDAQLFLDNSSPLTVKVRDLNEDGMEDIVLLSEEAGGNTFVAFAGKKGRFKKSDFEDITPYLNGEDFSHGSHPLYLWSDGETEETVLVRPGQVLWGFDEEGNPLTNDETENAEVASNTLPPTTAKRQAKGQQNSYQQNTSEQTCSTRLRYSLLRKVVESACDTESEETAESSAEKTFAPVTSMANLPASPPEKQISASAPAVPASVTADVDGDKITISWDRVTGASYYNRQVSINEGSFQNNKTYYDPQKSVIFENQQARTYQYRVRACNSSACSGWRMSSSVTVHAQNLPPSAPTSAPTISGGNYHPFNSSGISVYLPGVTGTYTYKLYVGTSPTHERDIIDTISNSASFTPGISSGFLYVRYVACNLVGCSDKSPWQRIYIYNIPGSPNNAAVSVSSVTSDSSATLSWNAAGGMIPNGFYKIIETRPGASAVQIGQILAGFQSSYGFSVSPNGVPGEYRYRIQSCNPGMACGQSPSRFITLQNQAPTVVNASFNVNEGSAVLFYASDYASDRDNHALTISGFTQPGNTSVGSVSCTSASCRFSATDTISSNVSSSFSYTVTDGYGGFASATVNVTVINQIEGFASTPVISPQGGTFSGSKSVSISSPTPGATIYYTTNGHNASRSSTQYTAPFTITDTTTVKAIAVAHDYHDSSQASQTYTLGATDVVLTYRYDALGRLVKVEDPQNGNRDYEYDDAGNRTTVTKQN